MQNHPPVATERFWHDTAGQESLLSASPCAIHCRCAPLAHRRGKAAARGGRTDPPRTATRLAGRRPRRRGIVRCPIGWRTHAGVVGGCRRGDRREQRQGNKCWNNGLHDHLLRGRSASPPGMSLSRAPLNRWGHTSVIPFDVLPGSTVTPPERPALPPLPLPLPPTRAAAAPAVAARNVSVAGVARRLRLASRGMRRPAYQPRPCLRRVQRLPQRTGDGQGLARLNVTRT